jgi:integrase
MPPRKLTVRLLEALKPGERVRDTDTKCLFAERGKQGGVSLKFQADLREGARTGEARKPVTIRMTLGAWPDLSIESARQRAAALRAEVRAGRDPRAPARAEPTGWTLTRGYDEYLRGREGLTVRDMRARLDRYLSDWAARPMAEITRDECVARHAKIAADIKARAASKRATGAKTANATLKDLRAVWAFVADLTPLPADPTRKIRLFGEVKAHHDIPISALPKWWAATGKLTNPLRREMHRLALLTGLRPANVMGLRKEWLHLSEPGRERIVFPRSVMKTKRGPDFVLPLTEPALVALRAALEAGPVLYKDTPFVFPTRNADGEVVATAVVREKAAALKDATGHALRHLWKTCARNARLPEVSIELLLDHSQPAMAAAYGSLAEQFDRLRADAATVAAYIIERASVPEVKEAQQP